VIQLNNKSELFSTETVIGEGVYEDASYSRIVQVAGSADGSPILNGIKVGFSEECKMQ
jgi:hypothetical protein